MKSSIFLAAFALLFSLNTSAQSIYKKNLNQRKRIHQGVRSGTITQKERKTIARQQHNVNLAIRVAKSDGRISSSERNIIRQEQRQTSHLIYRTKNNNRMR